MNITILKLPVAICALLLFWSKYIFSPTLNLWDSFTQYKMQIINRLNQNEWPISIARCVHADLGYDQWKTCKAFVKFLLIWRTIAIGLFVIINIDSLYLIASWWQKLTDIFDHRLYNVYVNSKWTMQYIHLSRSFIRVWRLRAQKSSARPSSAARTEFLR